MSGSTSIEWTETTWNPVRGCSRVSEGCRHCYAERQAARFRGDDDPFHGFAYSDKAGPHWTGKVELIPSKLAEPLRWRKPRSIFVNSMSDLFHEGLSDEAIAAVFGVMAACPQHTFQVLTKRPERMRRWFEWLHNTQTLFGFERVRYCAKVAHNKSHEVTINRDLLRLWDGSEVPPPWPLPNVWLGVSVENQETFDARVLDLVSTPAALRLISYEPALGPLDCSLPVAPMATPLLRPRDPVGGPGCVHWLIVGGESGPGARPCEVDWIRAAIEQCRGAGVPVFVKQLGARPYDGEEPSHDPNGADEPRWLRLRHPKGGDMAEWPEDLQARDLPGGER